MGSTLTRYLAVHVKGTGLPTKDIKIYDVRGTFTDLAGSSFPSKEIYETDRGKSCPCGSIGVAETGDRHTSLELGVIPVMISHTCRVPKMPLEINGSTGINDESTMPYGSCYMPVM